MKIILTIIFALLTSGIWASEHRLVDGKVQFAVAWVGDANGRILCWTQSEKDKAVADFEQIKATSPYTIENLTPTAFEVRVSTTFQFVNYSAFLETLKMPNEDLRDAKAELDRENKLKNFKKERK